MVWWRKKIDWKKTQELTQETGTQTWTTGLGNRGYNADEPTKDGKTHYIVGLQCVEYNNVTYQLKNITMYCRTKVTL